MRGNTQSHSLGLAGLPPFSARCSLRGVLECICPLPLLYRFSPLTTQKAGRTGFSFPRFSSLALLWLAVLAFDVGILPKAAAQASLQTILTNGPVSNRLNIVILSEGYASAQLPQFLADATNAVSALLAHQPYQEYSNYFNAFAIKIASPQSVSSHPSYDSYVNTYFNST